MSTNRDSRDSEGKYQDDCEDAMMAAGESSKEKRAKAKDESDQKKEAEKQEASKQAMLDAARSSRDRRKKKT
ncbi:hypothetical protein CH63R_09208 [Colletotrichum higginsianum IMI 349063]|uniref:Uncharacterized protein n=2 Tax=Colletotrichum higginsianum TaxID=80884 RepID=A0A1B7Y6R5_COLHI|nr:hypothetical protein CH63R_09208 [Colletotrichum higginsianum IMI 349063]OBR07687.1 hypothetical protein CH63R_09208 [Colletotrichum higginsianum IMI 349063]TIC91739.1 hypothetical protein CH35J_010613 [Colletotrichum higginsianum]GJC98217.1 hypothetical protein ColKHC_07043 [Colletotrichum higginsianum]